MSIATCPCGNYIDADEDTEAWVPSLEKFLCVPCREAHYEEHPEELDPDILVIDLEKVGPEGLYNLLEGIFGGKENETFRTTNRP